MSDIQITQGSGTHIQGDTVGSNFIQAVKVETGTTGKATSDPIFATLAASSSGDNTLVAAVTSKRIRVTNLVLVPTADVTIKFRTATTDITGAMPIKANVPFNVSAELKGLFQTNIGELLALNLGTAVACNGFFTYVTEA